MQHTPNDAAQGPLAVPPMALHSAAVKQVPMRFVVVVLHGPFMNLAIWNTLNTTATGHMIYHYNSKV